MNYLTEILEFNNWLDENPSSSSVIVLWYALMHINNKLRWKKSFAAPIQTLELKTGLKKDAIYRARNTLKQHGLIDFRERGANRCTEYEVIPFSERGECVVLNDTVRDTPRAHSATHSATQSEPDARTLYKQNKTNKNYNKYSARKNFNNFESEKSDYAAIEDKIIDMMLEE